MYVICHGYEGKALSLTQGMCSFFPLWFVLRKSLDHDTVPVQSCALPIATDPLTLYIFPPSCLFVTPRYLVMLLLCLETPKHQSHAITHCPVPLADLLLH